MESDLAVQVRKKNERRRTYLLTFLTFNFQHASESRARSARTGYITRLGNGTISYNSHRQSTSAQSITEAEYIAVSATSREMMFLTNLIDEFDIEINTDGIVMYYRVQNIRLLISPRSHFSAPPSVVIEINYLMEEPDTIHCIERIQHELSTWRTEIQLTHVISSPAEEGVE